MESRYRSIVKAITWRAIATMITSIVAFLLTGELHLAAAIGVVDTTVKLGAYYAHERAWNNVSVGRDASPEYHI